MNKGLWGAWAGLAVMALGLGLQAASIVQQRAYFPISYLWASFDCEPSAKDGRIPIVDAFQAAWYTEYWRTAHEPSLALKAAMGNRDRATYRFTWISSFATTGAAIVRIDEQADKSLRLIVTEMDIASHYLGKPPRVLARREKLLDEDEARRFRVALRAAQISKLGPAACLTGADGSRWIVEAAQGGRYHYVNRWSPRSGSVHDLGALFGELAGATSLQDYAAGRRPPRRPPSP